MGHQEKNVDSLVAEVQQLRRKLASAEYQLSQMRLDSAERQRTEDALQQRIQTLTHPGHDVSSLRFEDLFDLEEIQRIQDAFAMATGVASIITDLNGRPITRPSNFCNLCLNIIRKTDKGLANCMCSDAVLGMMNPNGPIIQPCLSGGLWDGGTSICVGDRHIANWLIGQILDDDADMNAMFQYAHEIGADDQAYREALGHVTRMPKAQFEKVCQALFLIARQLSRLALQNVQQARAIAERRQAEAALLEADQRKDEFLAMLSHELRNPLAPIRNAVQILNLTSAGDQVAMRQRGIIDRQVSHMARLLDDLLDVSRITRGKIRLKKEIIDLREVGDRAIETMRVPMEARRQVLVYSRSSAALPVMGDATRLEQVICNLLHNAIKYSEDSGRIWLELGTGELDGRGIVVAVRDEGIGIAPEMLPRIFEMFAQASQSLDRSQGGLGLGLTLVRTLVQLHGGRVEAASEGLGKGSTFTVWLPLATPDGADTPAGQAALELPFHAPDAGGARSRVLVVDDIADAAASMAEVLRLWGYPAWIASDGGSALALAREIQPQIILLDIGLPGMDGYEVARRLRSETGLNTAVLIALTGYGTAEDHQRAMAAGFDDHFAKPVDLVMLKNVLARRDDRALSRS